MRAIGAEQYAENGFQVMVEWDRFELLISVEAESEEEAMVVAVSELQEHANDHQDPWWGSVGSRNFTVDLILADQNRIRRPRPDFVFRGCPLA